MDVKTVIYLLKMAKVYWLG